MKFLKDGGPYASIKSLPLGVRRAIDCRLTVFSIHSAAQAMWDYLGEPQHGHQAAHHEGRAEAHHHK